MSYLEKHDCPVIYYFDNVTAISIGQETFVFDRTVLGKFTTIIKTNYIYMQGWVQVHMLGSNTNTNTTRPNQIQIHCFYRFQFKYNYK